MNPTFEHPLSLIVRARIELIGTTQKRGAIRVGGYFIPCVWESPISSQFTGKKDPEDERLKVSLGYYNPETEHKRSYEGRMTFSFHTTNARDCFFSASVPHSQVGRLILALASEGVEMDLFPA